MRSVRTALLAVLVVLLAAPKYARAADIPSGKIAFASDRTGTDEVYMMNSDGTNVQQITSGTDKNTARYAPLWSPDGSHLVYYERLEGNSGNLVIVNADGSNPVVLVSQQPINNTYRYLDWSADGQWILYCTYKTDSKNEPVLMFHLVRIDGGERIDVNPEGVPRYYTVQFLNNNTLFASDDSDLGLIQISIKGLKRSPLLTYPPRVSLVRSLSPDGKQVATTLDSDNKIGLVTLKDGAITPLATIPEITFVTEMNRSPDGNWLVVQGYKAYAPDVPTPEPTAVLPIVTRIISRDGRIVQPVKENKYGYTPRITWSPDSQYIAYDDYVSNRDRDYQIFVSRVDGSGAVQLTSEGGNGQPAWQPRR